MTIWWVAFFAAATLAITHRRLALVPVGAVLGWTWGGLVTLAPAVVLSAILLPAIGRWRRNRTLRQTLLATERCLESMFEMSTITLQPDEILAAGGPQASFLLADSGAPHWLQTSLRQLFWQDAVRAGLSLERPLLILLQEVEQRMALAGQWRNEQAALTAATILFLCVELALAATVLASPAERSLFQSGAGRWLSAWVLLSTASMLSTPWFQPESLLW